ncbi:MAG: hypothetical protein AAFV53_21215 [Myxococcota bacterium]
MSSNPNLIAIHVNGASISSLLTAIESVAGLTPTVWDSSLDQQYPISFQTVGAIGWPMALGYIAAVNGYEMEIHFDSLGEPEYIEAKSKTPTVKYNRASRPGHALERKLEVSVEVR